tara:strand:- start:23386 stop:24972 length:1587 start_codon:yes stop_codon:yes gene_type:complete
MNQFLSLNTESLEFNDSGVVDYLWPITHDEIISFRNNFSLKLYSHLREKGIEHNDDNELLWLHAAQCVQFAMSLFNASVVIERFNGLNVKPFWGDNDQIYLNISKKKKLASNNSLKVLQKGLPEVSRIRKLLRPLNTFVTNDGLIRKSKHHFNTKDIFTFSVSPLIESHVKENRGNVVFWLFADWYPSGPTHENKLPPGASKNCLLGLGEVLNESFKSMGVKLDEFLMESYIEQIKYSTRYIQFYKDSLEKNNKIPKIFWCGTAGNPWNRIMARVVSKNNGHVVGHDHGTSSGSWVTSLIETMTEFNYVDDFYTYTNEMALGIINGLNKKLLINENKTINIIGLNNSKESKLVKTNKSSGIKNIMYVATTYASGSDILIEPIYADMVVLDWQYRLFRHLQKMGMTMYFKTHPESICLPPNDFKRFNVNVLFGKFEDEYEKADILIFDSPQSSTFITALKSNLPIILIDTGRVVYQTKAIEKLKKRVNIIKASVSRENRINFDFEKLTDAIKNIGMLDNNEFLNEFYSI